MKISEKNIKKDLRKHLSNLREIQKRVNLTLACREKRVDILTLFDQVRNFSDLAKAFINSSNKKFSLVYVRMMMDIVYQIEQYRMLEDRLFFTKIDNQSLFKKRKLAERNENIKSGPFGQKIFDEIIRTENSLSLLTRENPSDMINQDILYKIYQDLSDYVHMNPQGLRFANRKISEKYKAHLLFVIRLSKILSLSLQNNKMIQKFFLS